MEEQEPLSVEKLTRAYLKIRDAKAELSAEFKAREAELNSQLDSVKGALLTYCKDHGVDSVRTAAGLFYRSVKTRYWTNDWESMSKFVLEHSVPEFLEKRLNQSAVKQFLEENPDVMPMGLNVDSEYVVSVRKK